MPLCVSNGAVYTSGMIDGTGFLFKLDLEGKLIYKQSYGPEFTESWHGTRGTPVIVGNKIYLESGLGKLVCLLQMQVLAHLGIIVVI